MAVSLTAPPGALGVETASRPTTICPMATTHPAKRRATNQGAAVKEALAAEDTFRSAQDVYATLRASGEKIGRAHV